MMTYTCDERFVVERRTQSERCKGTCWLYWQRLYCEWDCVCVCVCACVYVCVCV